VSKAASERQLLLYRAVLRVGSWVQPHPGVTRFDPDHLRSWLRDVSGGAFDQSARVRAAAHRLYLEIFLEDATIGVDFSDALFTLKARDYFFYGVNQVECRPWEADAVIPAAYMYGRTTETFRAVVCGAWQRSLETFRGALEAGQWTVLGRPRSPCADLKRVPFEIWKNADVLDWERGIARLASGDLIYGLRAAAAVSSASFGLLESGPPSRTRKPTSAYNSAKRQAALEALNALYPAGVPASSSLPNKLLIGAVEDWCRNEGRLVLSADTILRAAGRRGNTTESHKDLKRVPRTTGHG
jgi:hypothetical protein